MKVPSAWLFGSNAEDLSPTHRRLCRPGAQTQPPTRGSAVRKECVSMRDKGLSDLIEGSARSGSLQHPREEVSAYNSIDE